MKIPTSISLLTGKGLQFKITGAFPVDVNEEIGAEAFRTDPPPPADNIEGE